MVSRRGLVVLALEVAALGFSAAASAQQPPDAAQRQTPSAAPTAGPDAEEAEYQPAIESANSGQREEALAMFRAIFERTHAPRAQARMGTTEIQLGRWLAAEAHLRGALASEQDTWVSQHRVQLNQALERARENLADLEVACPVGAAELSVNGQVVGTFPLTQPVRVLRGRVTIDVTAPGYEPVRQVIAVTSASGRAEVSLVREVAPPLTSVGTTAQTGRPERTTATIPPTESGGPWRALGITSLVLGGLAVGSGVAGWIMRDDNAHDFNAAACWAQGGVGMGGRDCSSLYDAGMSMNTLALAGGVTGGALLAAGVVMLVAAPSTERRLERAFDCGMGPGVVGVRCRVRF